MFDFINRIFVIHIQGKINYVFILYRHAFGPVLIQNQF